MVDQAYPFAQALLSIGSDQGLEDRFTQDFRAVEEVMNDNPELNSWLRHPGVSAKDKEELLLKIFEGTVSDPFRDFLKIVCRHHQAGNLLVMAKDYQALLDESRHIQTVHVESASALDERQKAKLKAALERKLGGQVRLVCAVNPDLIAGMRIQTENSTMDASYRGRLDKMKEQLHAS